MNKEWFELLQSVYNEYKQLEAEKIAIMTKWSKDNAFKPNDGNFEINTQKYGPQIARSVFKWDKYLNSTGSICLNYLDNIQTGITFYDIIVKQIYPVEKHLFEQLHNFGFRDFSELRRLSEGGKVVFWLTSDPEDYLPHEYLLNLFEGAKVVHVPWATMSIADMNDWEENYKDYEKMTEDFVESDSFKEIFKQASEHFGERYTTTETEMLVPLQELRYLDLPEIEKIVWFLMEASPSAAFVYLSALRRLLFNPVRFGAGMTTGFEKRNLMHDAHILSRSLKLHNITLPGEIGAVLGRKLLLPMPESWDAVKWCDDHLDLSVIRRGVHELEQQALEKQVLSTNNIEEYQLEIEEIWKHNIKSFQRTKTVNLWAGTLLLGMAGVAAAGPLVGVLTALGLTAASNIGAEPFSVATAKLLKAKPYHIWSLEHGKGILRKET